MITWLVNVGAVVGSQVSESGDEVLKWNCCGIDINEDE